MAEELDVGGRSVGSGQRPRQRIVCSKCKAKVVELAPDERASTFGNPPGIKVEHRSATCPSCGEKVSFPVVRTAKEGG